VLAADSLPVLALLPTAFAPHRRTHQCGCSLTESGSKTLGTQRSGVEWRAARESKGRPGLHVPGLYSRSGVDGEISRSKQHEALVCEREPPRAHSALDTLSSLRTHWGRRRCCEDGDRTRIQTQSHTHMLCCPQTNASNEHQWRRGATIRPPLFSFVI
jgi:hypothetical protein